MAHTPHRMTSSSTLDAPPLPGVPWPIAGLCLWYAAAASAAAGGVWRALDAPRAYALNLLWSSSWVALAGAAVFGLAWLRPWGRRLAILAAYVMMVNSLVIGLAWAGAGQPWPALVLTVFGGLQMVIVRYLGRPVVERWFRGNPT